MIRNYILSFKHNQVYGAWVYCVDGVICDLTHDNNHYYCVWLRSVGMTDGYIMLYNSEYTFIESLITHSVYAYYINTN